MSWLKDILDENRRVVNSWPAWKKGAVMTRKEELEKKVKEVFQCEAFGDNVGKSDVLELLIEVEREVWEKVIHEATNKANSIIKISNEQQPFCDGFRAGAHNMALWCKSQQQELA